MKENDSKIPIWLQKNWIFMSLLLIVLVDRVLTIYNFNLKYTDIDQVIMWHAAFEYSQGIFHEPFFYGQNYNYMLESILAVPLIWFKVPVYYALPIITNVLAILPFILLSIYLLRREEYSWSYTILLFLLLLPLDYNFLTSISRGFVQAHLFIPFIVYSLIYPTKKKYHLILFLSAALGLIMNMSSIIVIGPALLYIYSFNYGRLSFYLKSVIILPILYFDYLAKNFYLENPERLMHSITGFTFDWKTLKSAVSSVDHYNFLFPFSSNIGYSYLILLLLFIIIAISIKNKKAIIFIALLFLFLIITMGVPKVQTLYENAGILFSRSRLFTLLPLSALLAAYLLFKDLKFNIKRMYLFPFIGIIAFSIHNINISEKSIRTASESVFPMEDMDKLIGRIEKLELPVEKYDVNLVLNRNGWKGLFESYAFKPVAGSELMEVSSACIIEDRKRWIFEENNIYSTILLNDLVIPEYFSEANKIEYTSEGYILLRNNDLSLNDLIKEIRDSNNQ